MIQKLQRETRLVLEDAREVAQELEPATLEAEHLLLAVARRQGTVGQRLLEEVGLGEAALRDAVAADFTQSLAAVGIRLADFDLPLSGGLARTPRWGASAKLAIKRMSAIARRRGDRRLSPDHLLLGVLAAPAGTVPRALAFAAVDPVVLVQSLEFALAATEQRGAGGKR
jgi:ATP-dependent Clp protease ATP-binding subunit ClpA